MSVTTSVLYFAYGSNMNSKDLQSWCVDRETKISLSNPIVACLKDFKLAFTHKSERRSGGVADVVRKPEEETWGVLFETDDESLKAIDKKEGVGSGVYRRIEVKVLAGRRLVSNVITYEVVKKGIYRPSRDYLDVILKGAEEHRLPSEYIEKIRTF